MTKLNGYLGGIGGEKENKSQMISPGADARHIHIDVRELHIWARFNFQ